MLLILTNSVDSTSDEIVRRIGAGRVFRLNIDQWRQYRLVIDRDGFEISDPSGRSIRESKVRACYLRKPTFDDPIDIPASGSPEAWTRSEVGAVIGEIYGMCRSRGLVRLVEKGAGIRVGKLQQLRAAERFFRVPRWQYHWGDAVRGFPERAVAKPLGADFVQDWRFFFTSEVVPAELDIGFPWFVQERIDASHDETVVYVDGTIFAFRLDRGTISGIDWRRDIFSRALEWRRQPQDGAFESAVRGFMESAGLAFGRLDFLVRNGERVFLEVNPNGQWGWLDLEGREGIFDRVVQALTQGWAHEERLATEAAPRDDFA